MNKDADLVRRGLLAPEECIVCHKPFSEQKGGWSYIAGADPPGAMACSAPCVKIAVDRWERTGRCDEKS